MTFSLPSASLGLKVPNETVNVLVFQTNPVGDELFSFL